MGELRWVNAFTIIMLAGATGLLVALGSQNVWHGASVFTAFLTLDVILDARVSK